MSKKKGKRVKTPARAHKLITALTTKLAMAEITTKLIRVKPPKTPDLGLANSEIE